ncbi:MAG: RIP metalloprotease [Caulobacterales bacterium]
MIVYVVSFLAVLSLVIFVHEFGHFQVARWLKIRADAFALGFGKELWGRTDRRGTRWKLGAIPLGGYVRFAEELPKEGLAPGESLFAKASLWRRSAVVAAGPLANFVFSSLAFALIFAVAGKNILAPVIGEVSPNMPAAAAGFQPGDRIIRAAGKGVESFDDFRRIVLSRGGETFQVEVLRSGLEETLTVSPASTSIENEFGGRQVGGRLGLQASGKVERLRYNPLQAVGEGVKFTGFICSETIRYITAIFRGEAPSKHIGGPLSIGKASGDAAKMGFEAGEGGLISKIGQSATALFFLAAVLSVSVGLFNLAPIPVLDGGHLLFFAVEGLSGKEPSARLREVGYGLGLAALMCLMVFAFWNDLGNLGLLKFLGGIFS